jgi:YHS domain-containing protein
MEFLVDNWLYILFAAGMMFMMFKGGGCCGGHSQDSHSNEIHGSDKYNQNFNQFDSARDPICGMIVNPEDTIKQIIDGKTYYFCSESCRKEFVRRQNK